MWISGTYFFRSRTPGFKTEDSPSTLDLIRTPESPLGGGHYSGPNFSKKRPLGRVPVGQEIDLTGEIAGSKVWTGLRN